MEYKINQKELDTSFRVPSCVVDKHIRIATDNQLKVLLWLLRTSPDAPDIAAMCKALRMSREDAEDYLAYWVNAGVLTECGVPQAAPAPVVIAAPPAAPAAPVVPAVPVTPAAPAAAVTAPAVNAAEPKAASRYENAKPSAAEIAARINESPEISCLFREAQNKLGKLIGYDLQCTLLMMHDYDGLPVEVIFMLLEYCASIGKTHNNYIASVGRTWGEKEIDSIEKAAEKISQMRNADSAWKEFSLLSGITVPRPSSSQSAYLAKWINDLGFSMDMIIAAYEEMADHTGRLSFPYIDKVLTSWHNEGIKTVRALKSFKEKPAPSKPSKKSTAAPKAEERKASPSYDISLFEKAAVSETLHYERKKKA